MCSLVDQKELRKESLSLKMTAETYKIEKQREKEKKKKNRIYKNCGTTTKHKIYIQKIPKEKRGEENPQVIFEAIIIEIFPY